MSSNNPEAPDQQPRFDRRGIRLRRERSGAEFHGADFLHRRAVDDIVDRLETVTRAFPKAIFVGAGELVGALTPDCGVGKVFLMDAALNRLPSHTNRFVADEDALPVAAGSVDLFVSVLTLHTVNDFVGALVQARRALKPDGLFLAAVFADGTLQHWRTALQRAETETTGALAARIAPFAAVQDFGQAMARAGFAMPVTDVDPVSVAYREPLNLLKDLRMMGETRVLAGPSAPLRRDTVTRALHYFSEMGAGEMFNIAYLTGWAPDPSQPKPAPRGSATASMADAVKKFSEQN